VPKNLEFKARCESLDALQPRLADLKATHRETIHQVDTYFHSPAGRLKLREIAEKGEGWLIYYERPNRHTSRYSQYQLCKIAEPAELKSLLTAALGIKAIVKKQRALWMFNNTRIHLDTVESLGQFVELETIESPPLTGEIHCHEQTEVEAVAEHQHVKTTLALDTMEPIAVSYSDLILPMEGGRLSAERFRQKI